MVHCVHDWTVRGIDDYLAKALLGFNDFSSCLAKNDVLFVSLWIQRYESTHQHPKWETYYSLSDYNIASCFFQVTAALFKKKKPHKIVLSIQKKTIPELGLFRDMERCYKCALPLFLWERL